MARRRNFYIVVSLLLCCSGFSKIITVNTTNNVSPIIGETNLVQAISLLSDGDTIRFNIPGPGPFYIVTPPLAPDNGYPPITNHNVTIDGYSQPGSSPNTNPILGSNNANIKIALDSRAGGTRVDVYTNSYDASESALLFIEGATNVTIKGLCFLGPGYGSKTSADPSRYAVSFAAGADYGRVQGCRFGLDLDNVSVYPFADAVTGFMIPNGPWINGTVVGVAKNAATSAEARSQFNLIMGEFIEVILEGDNERVCGNFFNVFPDGMHDYNMDSSHLDFESFIESGQRCNNLVFGTDSDGHNDDEERNVFGGVVQGPNSHMMIQLYRTNPGTNVVIAGNYFGMAIDGKTRFTNCFRAFAGFSSNNVVRVGSDFDGFEDQLEANVFSMTFGLVVDNFLHLPVFASVPGNVNPPARISLRGNRLLGNNTPFFTWPNLSAGAKTRFTNIFTAFVQTNNVIPRISPTSTPTRLRGVCAVGKGSFTNVVIDIYIANEEGWTNGMTTQFGDLAYTDPTTMNTAYYGFAQGETYLGSFVENGPEDADRALGSFDFDISGLHIPPGRLITFTANYSDVPPGTSNAGTVTTPFANARILEPLLAISQSEGQVRLAWGLEAGSYTVQSTANLRSPVWTALDPQPTIQLEGDDYVVYLSCPDSTYFRLSR